MDQLAARPPAERQMSDYQRKFAENVASGLPYAEAYRKAGYTGQFPWRDQKRIFTPAVKSYIFEIRQSAATAAKQTVEQLLGELDDARLLAMIDRQPTAVVSAIMGKAKLLGYLVDKSEIELHLLSKPSKDPTEIVDLSIDEWKQQFAGPLIEGK